MWAKITQFGDCGSNKSAITWRSNGRAAFYLFFQVAFFQSLLAIVFSYKFFCRLYKKGIAFPIIISILSTLSGSLCVFIG